MMRITSKPQVFTRYGQIVSVLKGKGNAYVLQFDLGDGRTSRVKLAKKAAVDLVSASADGDYMLFYDFSKSLCTLVPSAYPGNR
tara:strand:- start:116 stop:367 length:252 start_codon:yes stop_codon:yes gene_type:complete